jgi:hypothetical protein
MSVRQHNTSAHNSEILQVNNCVNNAELAPVCTRASVFQQFGSSIPSSASSVVAVILVLDHCCVCQNVCEIIVCVL